MDFGSAKGKTSRKSKSIGQQKDMLGEELEDDVQSIRSSQQNRRSKSRGEDSAPLMRKKSRTNSFGAKSGKKMGAGDDIEKQKSRATGSSRYKQVIHLFVARDSNMFVFETHFDLLVEQAKFKAEIFEVLNYYQEEIKEEEERPPTYVKPLIFDKLQLHLHYDVIYYGLIAPDSFSEDQAQRLLSDVKEEVRKIYKGNVVYMRRQTNLEHNCMKQILTPKIEDIISKSTLDNAHKQVEDMRLWASDIIQEQNKNMAHTSQILEDSQNALQESLTQNDGSKALASSLTDRDGSSCFSKRCVLILIALIIVVAISVYVAMTVTGAGEDDE